MLVIDSNNSIKFLDGDGEMETLIREKDWSKISIGSPDKWPQSLCTILGIILHSSFPMFLFWDKDLICFYNEAFRPSLGSDGKHPAIGKKGMEVWPEIWEFIGPLIQEVIISGKPVWFEDQLVPFYRNGKIEDIYWTFSYSPAYGDDGQINGVFVTCTETTDKIRVLKEIRQREEQLNFIINAASLGTWDLNLSTNVFSINHKVMEWFGLQEKSEIELSTALTNVVDKDKKKIIDAMQEALQPGSDGNFEIEYSAMNPKTGKERHLLTKGKALFNENNIAYKFSGTIQDISKQVGVQKQLLQNERNLRSIILQAPVSIAIFGGENYIVEIVNSRALSLWGRSEKEIIHKPILEAMPELNEQGIKELLDNVYKTGKSFFATEFPVQILKKGELETLYMNFIYEALYDINGTINGIVTVGSEVTEQVLSRQKIVNAFQKIKDNEEKLNIVINATELGTWELDLATDDMIISDRFMEIFGYPKGTILEHKQILNSLHPDDVGKRNKAFNESLLSGNLHYESRVNWNDNSIHWIEVKGRVFYNENNKPLKLIGTVRDISEQKMFAQQLEIQVQERTSQLEQKNKELEKINAELQSFAYVSGHDLQEPLRKIQTFSSWLLEKENQNLSETGKDYFMRMQGAAKRMQTLIEDLLAYSRANTSERLFVNVSLGEIIEQVKMDMKEFILEKNAIIETGNLCNIHAVPFQFAQLMNNLISNALKFSRPGVPPVIKINCEIVSGDLLKRDPASPDKSYYHISVADNGIGFDAQYKDRIFEVFQRLHTKEEYAGTGIGLAIVKKIVENHKGFISATSQVNSGATFDIYIPEN
jgi:PAS domain S-box-containing protein